MPIVAELQVKLKFSHMKLTNSPSSITLVLMQPASNGDKPLTSWQSCKKRKTYVLSIQSLKLGFQLVLCRSRSHISLVLGHFLLVLENDFVRGWLGAWALKVPTGQVSFKKYLPSKKIYFLLVPDYLMELFPCLLYYELNRSKFKWNKFSGTYP